MLTKGWACWVDAEDFERLAKYRWQVAVDKMMAYAIRRGDDPEDRCLTVRMHREILRAGEGIKVDHWRHFPLDRKVVDNRRNNLRVASSSQNAMNRRKRKAASPFKGVWRDGRKWRAELTIERTTKALGHYWNEAYAAYAYDLAALRAFGEFALTNFPIPGSANWLYGEGGAQ